MTPRPIPHDDIGYAVDPDFAMVHTRYADHAEGLPRTRTIQGVINLLGYRGQPCDRCYPPPPESPLRPRRRALSQPEPAPVDEEPVAEPDLPIVLDVPDSPSAEVESE